MADGGLADRVFGDIVDLLAPGDLLVFNDTRVLKARFFGVKESGGKVEVLVERVLREAGPDGVSATECAERTGLSRVSARRYLEHFSRTGGAEVSARYGGTGRPERRFRAP